MNTHKFMVEEIRFHLNDPNKIVFVGWYYDGTTKNHMLKVQLDGKELPVELLINRGVKVYQKYIHNFNEIGEEVVGIIQLPENWENSHRLTIKSSYKGSWHGDASYSVARLKKLQKKFRYEIANVKRTADKIIVNGWCLSGEEIKLSLLDEKKQPMSMNSDVVYKTDPERIGPEDEKREKMFFTIQTDQVKEKVFYLEMSSAKTTVMMRLDRWNHASVWMRLLNKAKVVIYFLKRDGFKTTMAWIIDRLGQSKYAIYENWLKKYGLTEEELQKQRETQKDFAYRPKFSIAVPLYRTEERFLRELISSVQNQTYDNWELCFADGSEDGGKGLAAIVEEYQRQDERIHYHVLEKNYGIAQNMNAAMHMAQGEFVSPVDHDDTLSPNALYEFAKTLNEHPSVEVLYSDEDKIDMEGSHYFEPHFKADYDLDFFLTNNYICHLLAVKCSLAAYREGFLSEYDGSQDFDFILRCCEEAEEIYHVPKVLYHWRCHFDSTSANPQSKQYAFEAGRRAVQAHYDRLGIPAEAEHAQFYGLYRTRYHWKQKPLVSILIPCRDNAKELERCIESVLCSDYDNYEIVVLEHNSARPETFAYYDKLTMECERIRILNYCGEENSSKIFNLGAKESAGEYMLLLDCRIQMTDGVCIDELLGYCMRADVGAVGAKLIYEDDTIAHAGIVLGFGGTVGYVFRGKSRYAAGYESRVICAQDYSAVSGLCMMVKRSVYEEVGGMSEEFLEEFYDIDFCLKIRERGWLVVYNPYAELYYYGPKEAAIPTAVPKARDNREIELLTEKWKETITSKDPYYNPNLTLEKMDFSLSI